MHKSNRIRSRLGIPSKSSDISRSGDFTSLEDASGEKGKFVDKIRRNNMPNRAEIYKQLSSEATFSSEYTVAPFPAPSNIFNDYDDPEIIAINEGASSSLPSSLSPYEEAKESFIVRMEAERKSNTSSLRTVSEIKEMFRDIAIIAKGLNSDNLCDEDIYLGGRSYVYIGEKGEVEYMCIKEPDGESLAENCIPATTIEKIDPTLSINSEFLKKLNEAMTKIANSLFDYLTKPEQQRDSSIMDKSPEEYIAHTETCAKTSMGSSIGDNFDNVNLSDLYAPRRKGRIGDLMGIRNSSDKKSSGFSM